VVEYLLEHPDKIIWDYFCSNEQPLAVVYLIEHRDEIDWFQFSGYYLNLLDNLPPDRIHMAWYNISKSNCIFVLDKEKMRATKAELHQDLVKHFLHPGKITKWIATGQDVLDYPYFS
jgi:hypothetical protein